MTVAVHTEGESAMGWACPPALALNGWITPSPDLSGEGRLGPGRISSFAIERFATQLLFERQAVGAEVMAIGRGHQMMPSAGGACRDSGGWGGVSIPTGIGAVVPPTSYPQGRALRPAEQFLRGLRSSSADKAESSSAAIGGVLQQGRSRSNSMSSALTPQAMDAAARQVPADRQACHPQSSQK